MSSYFPAPAGCACYMNWDQAQEAMANGAKVTPVGYPSVVFWQADGKFYGRDRYGIGQGDEFFSESDMKTLAYDICEVRA